MVAGKSIKGGRREICYHISDRTYLPKFISPKNPFAPVKVEPPANVAVAPIQKKLAADGTKTQKLPVLSQTRRQEKTWFSKLNPISIWRQSASSAAQKNQHPLQAELSLDRVKVVHNDLSDADVEIVPIKSRPVPEAAEPVLMSAQGEDSWSRLSAKIFGVRAA